MKIYRGISSKYKTEPFVPSGCRDSQIDMMIREIDGFVYINYDSFRSIIRDNLIYHTERIFPFYRNASPDAYFNYFLTLLFMNIKFRRNEIIEDFFSYQVDLLQALNGLTKINRRELADFCWEETHIPLYSDNLKNIDRFKKSLVVSSYFQHLNHIFENRTPTLGLDWTDDYLIAKMFGDIIVSIDLEKYLALVSSWSLTSYKDPINQKNKLMKEQRGYVIFWPWGFTIEELKSNSFGKAIDFAVEI